MAGTSSIHRFLHDAQVPYNVMPHPPAFTAQEEAAATHVPGRNWAKVVVCFVDGRAVEVMLPATALVDLQRLLELAGGEAIRLANEAELRQLFPECEPGAMPPFGPLYHEPVFADVALAGEEEIAFNGGTHNEAIAMRWADFARTVRPIVGRFACRPPLR